MPLKTFCPRKRSERLVKRINYTTIKRDLESADSAKNR
ncbi:hypothetical protein SAMD00020551_4880 [Mesobacillus selenatarsenatis SF-1]|uniref:Uncharacterized protein n=1 Tax=Mesobacillus selenatarsenatis (strain DSM 18680 / JCM 14380 / FERM P-15431 / SF-1) TaxID=1321606 RepID=A0A0A8X9K3_MESS1|nr:hypothetical protein SAMD00020551_4880 [Mesobacillus selenatarsenatis SF-1]